MTNKNNRGVWNSVIFGFAKVRNEAIETKMAARKEQLALDLEDLAENCQQFKWNKAKKKKKGRLSKFFRWLWAFTTFQVIKN